MRILRGIPNPYLCMFVEGQTHSIRKLGQPSCLPDEASPVTGWYDLWSLLDYGPGLTRWFPWAHPRSLTQTASRSLQPFLQGLPGDKQTDRSCYSVGNKKVTSTYVLLQCGLIMAALGYV